MGWNPWEVQQNRCKKQSTDNYELVNTSKQERIRCGLESIRRAFTNPPDSNPNQDGNSMLLGYLIDQYEEQEFPISYPNPVDAIKIRMNDLGNKGKWLAGYLWRSGHRLKSLKQATVIIIVDDPVACRPLVIAREPPYSATQLHKLRRENLQKFITPWAESAL